VLTANPVGAGWELGQSTVEVFSGESTGIHIGNFMHGNVDPGRELSNTEYAFTAVNAVVGWALIGMSVSGGGGRGLPENPMLAASEAEIDAALDTMSAPHIFRGPVAATEAGIAPESMVAVSRWGRPGLQPGDWIMNGPPNFSNYVRSFKWDPNPTNIRTPFAAGEGYLVPAESVRWPTGWGLDGRWKGIFGQRRYVPTTE
jgi:hypothetical protein